ncbi:uncharacterized protein LOC111901973 [Lactuca sativa]|uniref:uncharacterized protein LOC111901973 n=1 Tax=Lactuca sativa TaxID=4236 RepID=UPI000CC2D6AC|nr:uncharacterized protein LOC111901973 [Lactuca sativa]
MDATQEEMKFVGLLGIFSKSFKTVFAWKKIFTQITLTLILPLAIIFIAHTEISCRFFHQIEEDPYQMFVNAYEYYRSYISQTSPTELLFYILFKITSIALVTLFSLLSTAAVVYAIASVYTGSDVTYRKLMKVVPKVWKRLTVSFICMFLTFFAYNLISSVVFFLSSVIFMEFYILFAISIPYIFGFLYLAIVWQLAIVISVLESCYGLKAMIKSMDLMKGKRRLALMVSFLLYGLLGSVVFMYLALVVLDAAELAVVWQAAIGILCCVLLVIMFLLIMVIQTVLYLVCKSHHREAIDKVGLSTYLGAYLSNSQPAFMVGEDIQLGGSQNQPVSQV